MTGAAIALLGLAVLVAVAGFLAWRGERARASARSRTRRRCASRSSRSAARSSEGDRAARARRRGGGAAAPAREGEAPRLQRAGRDGRRSKRAPTALEAELRERERECKRLRDEVAKLEGDVDGARRDTTRLREEAALAVQERDKAARVARIDPDEHRGLAHRADAAEEEVRRLTAQLRDVERDAHALPPARAHAPPALSGDSRRARRRAGPHPPAQRRGARRSVRRTGRSAGRRHSRTRVSDRGARARARDDRLRAHASSLTQLDLPALDLDRAVASSDWSLLARGRTRRAGVLLGVALALLWIASTAGRRASR